LGLEGAAAVENAHNPNTVDAATSVDVLTVSFANTD
jgi:hypothetical protein